MSSVPGPRTGTVFTHPAPPTMIAVVVKVPGSDAVPDDAILPEVTTEV